MSEFLKFIAETRASDSSKLHTAILAQILNYDPILMQADLQPLIRDPAFEYAPIVKASVSCFRAGGFIIRPPYQPGDIVVAVIIERGIDDVFDTGTKAEQVGKRHHSLTDAVVIGGFTARPFPLPEDHGQDLLISTEDGSKKIIMDPDGNIQIETSGTIDISSIGDIKIKSEGIVKIDGEQILLNSEEEGEEE